MSRFSGLRSNLETLKGRTNMFKGNDSYKNTATTSIIREKVELTPSKKAEISMWAKCYNRRNIALDLSLFVSALIGLYVVFTFFF